MIDFINKMLGIAIGVAGAVFILSAVNSCSQMPIIGDAFVDGATPQEIQRNVIEADKKKPCD